MVLAVPYTPRCPKLVMDGEELYFDNDVENNKYVLDGVASKLIILVK